MAENPRLVVVTGMSGAGRSRAARFLEDQGYSVVDNLPPKLIADVVSHLDPETQRSDRLAVVVDSRRGLDFDQLELALRSIDRMGVVATVLFMDADDDALLRRYSENRRPHPVAANTLAESIATERRALSRVRESADLVVDTTDLSVPELDRKLSEAFAEGVPERPMRIGFESFGFKYGTPRNVDLMFDARFLPNPYWEEGLRPLSGRDGPVRDFVIGLDDAVMFLDQVVALLRFLIPRYQAEGKAYLTVGVGCTGGRHRSVALVEEIARRLGEDTSGIAASIHHRDVDR